MTKNPSRSLKALRQLKAELDYACDRRDEAQAEAERILSQMMAVKSGDVNAIKSAEERVIDRIMRVKRKVNGKVTYGPWIPDTPMTRPITQALVDAENRHEKGSAKIETRKA